MNLILLLRSSSTPLVFACPVLHYMLYKSLCDLFTQRLDARQIWQWKLMLWLKRRWLQFPGDEGQVHLTPTIPAEEMWRGDVFLIFLESSQIHCSQHFPAILISFGFGHQTRGGREFVHMGMQPTAPLMHVQLYLQLGWNVSPLLYLTPLRTHPTPTISERKEKKRKTHRAMLKYCWQQTALMCFFTKLLPGITEPTRRHGCAAERCIPCDAEPNVVTPSRKLFSFQITAKQWNFSCFVEKRC